MNFFFDDSNKHISGDSAPQLNAHGALARAQKMLNVQVLFDPFEAQDGAGEKLLTKHTISMQSTASQCCLALCHGDCLIAHAGLHPIFN